MKTNLKIIFDSFVKNKKAWALGGALTALTTIWGANEIMSPEPTQEEQTILSEIAELDKKHVKQTVSSCFESRDFVPSRGAELALAGIHELYKDNPAQEAKVKKFLLDNEVEIHAVSAFGTNDDIYAVFRNDGNGGRSLIIQSGMFNLSNFDDQLVDMLNQIMDGDLLEKPNITSVIRYGGDNDYKGVHTIPYISEFDDFKLNPDLGTGNVEVYDATWEDACPNEIVEPE